MAAAFRDELKLVHHRLCIPAVDIVSKGILEGIRNQFGDRFADQFGMAVSGDLPPLEVS